MAEKDPKTNPEEQPGEDQTLTPEDQTEMLLPPRAEEGKKPALLPGSQEETEQPAEEEPAEKGFLGGKYKSQEEFEKAHKEQAAAFSKQQEELKALREREKRLQDAQAALLGQKPLDQLTPEEVEARKADFINKINQNPEAALSELIKGQVQQIYGPMLQNIVQQQNELIIDRVLTFVRNDSEREGSPWSGFKELENDGTMNRALETEYGKKQLAAYQAGQIDYPTLVQSIFNAAKSIKQPELEAQAREQEQSAQTQFDQAFVESASPSGSRGGESSKEKELSQFGLDKDHIFRKPILS